MAEELKDIRAHWAEWRLEWEHKLASNEIQFLRSVADLQGAFQHRVTLMEANFRDVMRSQHADFTARSSGPAWTSRSGCGRTWSASALEYERLIHTELRMIRQRAGRLAQPASPASRPCRHAARADADAARSITAGSPSASAARRSTSRQDSSSTCRYFRGCRERAGHRLRPRRVSGADARGRHSGAGHRPQRGIRGAVPRTRDWRPKPPTCSPTWPACRKPRSTAFSAPRWWSICRPRACRKWSGSARSG